LTRTIFRVGILDLSGTINSGHTQGFPIPLPLVGEAVLGSSSVQQAVRAAREQGNLAAIVAYVDSPGGSALASDIMERELRLLAQEKPLVVYMGSVAASGGYYIAAPAAHIMSQQATLTGSIGVVTAKIITGEAFDRLGVHRETVQRGLNAGLYSDDRAWDPAQRAHVEAGVEYAYNTFKQRVAEGRKLDLHAVEQVAGGRVFTGEQALANGLVDSLGDMQTAIQKAADLAGLPPAGEIRYEFVDSGRGGLLAEPVQTVETIVRWAISARADPALGVMALWKQALRSNRYWFIADHLPRI